MKNQKSDYSLLRILFILIVLLIVSFSGNAVGKTLQLVAVQMKLDIDDFFSREIFEEKIISLMEKTADKINPGLPALVVFPEDVGLMLIAQNNEMTLQDVDDIEEAIKKMTMRYFLPVSWNRLRYKMSWVPALYYHHSEVIAESYFQTFSRAAKKYQVYIVAGSVPLPHYQINNGQVFWQEGPLSPQIYNTSYLFDPEGKIVGYQDKVHLLELEQEEGLHLTPGDIEDIKVFETDAGRLGIAICLDGFKEDVIAKLKEQNAEILIQPSANPLPWDKNQQEEWLESSYKYTYELKHFKYAINPMMNGEFFNLNFFGQSSIINREKGNSMKGFNALEPVGGFLEISDTDNQEEILVTEIEL